MRYDVVDRVGPNDYFMGFNAGDAMRVRMYVEETPAKVVLTSLIMAAYDLSSAQGVGWLAAVDAPKELSVKDAAHILCYKEADTRTFWNKIIGVPDNRMPIGIKADYLHGRSIKLQVEASPIAGAYDVYTHLFVRDVGSVATLFRKTQELLPKVKETLDKPKSLLQRIFE